ncbi:CDP-alcohol phosphatidyltransferase family protein [Endozoicomonas sp. Mp262]|uniref:CDP-alcohol phosphatidyltransferase family protein n=1 Tax=Endozoicomonas sp. Mp262 TaxID=2919499 RepID=UPI0021D8FDE9
MLDQWTTRWVHPPLEKGASVLNKKGIHPDHVTLTGFLTGMTAIPLLATQHYLLALIAILINRTLDGLDGALARQNKATDAGGYLDITLDFIFYAGVVFGFALADPVNNALSASLLIFSFMGTGSSFLAYAIMAEKRKLTHPRFSHKSLYYLGGLAEGTETIIVFMLFCLLPEHFPALAKGFALICIITAYTRVWAGYKTIKYSEKKKAFD